MENSACCSCFKAKAPLECGICKESVCKSCAQFLEDGSFSFLAKVPAQLAHTTYCPQCFDKDVAGELATYKADLERAEDISVFEKAQSKETRNFKKFDETFSVTDCPDREEALLRLAFMAVRGGYNGLINVEVEHKKIRQGGTYTHHVYSATGNPAQVTEQKKWR